MIWATPSAALLTAVAVGGVPVVIHLLNRNRYREMPWAAMRFLQAAQQRTRQRLKLEQWLLLAVRALALVALAVAMAGVMPWAEPAWARLFPAAGRDQEQQRGRALRVVVIDASLSMNHERGGVSAFLRAKGQASDWVRKSPSGDRFAVLTLASPGEMLFGQPSPQRDRVAASIDEAEPTHTTGDLLAAVQRAAEIVDRHGSSGERSEVVFFTDFQRSGWRFPVTPGHPLTERWLALQTRASVAVVDVGAGRVENAAVTAFAPEEPLAVVRLPVAFTGTVHLFGDVPRSAAKVELWIGRADEGAAGLRRVQGQTVDLSPGQPVPVRWDATFDRPGEYLVQMRLEADRFPLDDERTLLLQVRERVPVLLVEGRPTAEPADRATFWIEQALQPFGATAPQAAYPAKPQRATTRDWNDASKVDWDTLDLVVLGELPRVSDAEVKRLERFVERGGGLVVALGPGVDRDNFARLFDRDGQGLIPAKLGAVRRAPEEAAWHPVAAPEALRLAPLQAFAGDAERAALASPSVQAVSLLTLRGDRPGRVLLSLSNGDPLMVEWSRGRGKVIVSAVPFTPEASSWPLSPAFPPLMQELLRYAVPGALTRTAAVGEPWRESLPATTPDLSATLVDPQGRSEVVRLEAADGGVRFVHGPLDRKGIYRVQGTGKPVTLVATLQSNPAESDLQPALVGDLPANAGATVPVVKRVVDLPKAMTSASDTVVDSATRVRGPSLVRYVLLAVVGLWCLETWLAYRFGAARRSPHASAPPSGWIDRIAGVVALLLAGATALAVAGVALALTDERLLPTSLRDALTRWSGAPTGDAGEGVAVRVEALPFWGESWETDRVAGAWLGVVVAVIAGVVVWRETGGVLRRPFSAGPLLLLRLALLAAGVLVLLPQVRLAFEREGWPVFAVLIDDSASMGATDTASSGTRLAQAQAFLATGSDPALRKLIDQRKVRVHVWRCSDVLGRVGEANSIGELDTVTRDIAAMKPGGEPSRLGEAVRALIGEYRGGGLAGVLFVSDGQTTAGDDLAAIAPGLGRSGVPIWCVGVGATEARRDIAVTSLLAEPVVQAGDKVVFEADIKSSGDWANASVPAVLVEHRDGRETEVARQTLTLDGRPQRLRFEHRPDEPGERVYIVRVPVQSGESDRTNNEARRAVEVLAFQKLRVLLIDSGPRYEFRYLKSLLERESGVRKGQATVELKTLLLDADTDAYRQDRTALPGFPATRDELFGQFDAVVLGDVDPQHPQLGERNLRWLAELVRERGGGLIHVAGPRTDPRRWRGTPLADVLPVEAGPNSDVNGEVIDSGFRLQLTAAGRQHPALRLSPNPVENAALWTRLMPVFWRSSGMVPRAGAELLATAPPDGAGTPEPVVVAQYVGAGRALSLGIEETWRWRFRADEVHYTQFWLGLLRATARPRQRRVELVVDRQTAYRPGEPIRLQARFPDDRPDPAGGQTVKVQSERVGGEPDVIALAPLAGARGVYEATLLRPQAGTYRFRLIQPAPPKPAEADATVLPSVSERDDPQPDFSALQQLAAATKGQALPLSEAGRMMEELPEFARVPLDRARPPWLLWNQPAVLAAVVGLLVVEWLLRKRQRLL